MNLFVHIALINSYIINNYFLFETNGFKLTILFILLDGLANQPREKVRLLFKLSLIIIQKKQRSIMFFKNPDVLPL